MPLIRLAPVVQAVKIEDGGLGERSSQATDS